MNRRFLALTCAGWLAAPAGAQWFNFTTLAGATGQGSTDGPSTNALFNQPSGLAMDASGNIWVADTAITPLSQTLLPAVWSAPWLARREFPAMRTAPMLCSIRRLPRRPMARGIFMWPTPGISRFAKSLPAERSARWPVCPACHQRRWHQFHAQFFEPEGLAVDGSSNVFVADTWNHTIRKITAAGVISTFADCPEVLAAPMAREPMRCFTNPKASPWMGSATCLWPTPGTHDSQADFPGRGYHAGRVVGQFRQRRR